MIFPLICFPYYIFVRDQFICAADFPHSGCGWLCFPGGHVSSAPHSFCLSVWGYLKFRSLFITTMFHGWCWVLTSCCIRSGGTSCLCESLSVLMDLTVTFTVTLPISFSLKIGAAIEDHFLALLFHEGWQNYVTLFHTSYPSVFSQVWELLEDSNMCSFSLASILFFCLLNEWTNLLQLHC